MSDLLKNDNITAYLFKKDNFKANTGLKEMESASRKNIKLNNMVLVKLF